MNNKKILLGDNPFFGIDHLSQERARQRAKVLTGVEKIAEVIEFASNLGVNDFVVSTHPQLKDLIEHLKSKTTLLETLNFYPILPYAQGYVSKSTEKGMAGAINDIVTTGSLQKKVQIFFNGTIGLVKKDYDKLLRTFIDVELLPLGKVKTNTIFLHNIVTDLAMSLGLKNVFETFVEHVEDKYKKEAGLVTKNFPKLLSTLEQWNMKIPTIMTSFNPIGYQMNPSREDCEAGLLKTSKVIAMNVLAGGFLKPDKSAEYISGLKLNSVVIGMSTIDHVKETIAAFRS